MARHNENNANARSERFVRPNAGDTAPSDNVKGPDAADAARAGDERVFKGSQDIDHDLFKLNVAMMKKNVSYDATPEYERVEHCHFFHTVDSNGRKQVRSSSVGGHHHDIEVIEEIGKIPRLIVSPPMVLIKKRKGKKKVTMSVPIRSASEPDGDEHTHTVEYRGSQKIKLRETNAEFMKYEGAVTLAQSPTVPGIGEIDS